MWFARARLSADELVQSAPPGRVCRRGNRDRRKMDQAPAGKHRRGRTPAHSLIPDPALSQRFFMLARAAESRRGWVLLLGLESPCLGRSRSEFAGALMPRCARGFEVIQRGLLTLRSLDFDRFFGAFSMGQENRCADYFSFARGPVLGSRVQRRFF